MTSKPQQSAVLLEKIEKLESTDLTAGSKPIVRFCLECLSLIKHKLPPVALEALDVSAAYLEGHSGVQSATDAAVRCWQVLEADFKGKDVDVPEVNAIRAAICLLDAQRHPHNRDVFMLLQYFLDFLNLVEPHLEEEELLFKKHFAQYL